jgi:hypothetical protein
MQLVLVPRALFVTAARQQPVALAYLAQYGRQLWLPNRPPPPPDDDRATTPVVLPWAMRGVMALEVLRRLARHRRFSCRQARALLSLPVFARGGCRPTLMTTLYARLTDRHNLHVILHTLTPAEQGDVGRRLGARALWSALHPAMAWQLQLARAEEAHVAYVLCDMAARGDAPVCLQQLSVNGQGPVSLAEDIALWMNVTSPAVYLTALPPPPKAKGKAKPPPVVTNPDPSAPNVLRFQFRALPHQRILWAVRTIQTCFRAYKISVGLKRMSWSVLRLQVRASGVELDPLCRAACGVAPVLAVELSAKLSGCGTAAQTTGLATRAACLYDRGARLSPHIASTIPQ